MDKVILTVQDHGNTSAASIPLALDVGIKNGQIKRGQNLLLEGIGGGFAWGAVLVKLLTVGPSEHPFQMAYSAQAMKSLTFALCISILF